ncbi:ATP-grasp fold amidoligase family protein [Pontibacillus litoralis]|uniref:Teichuronopeptide biosynthesis n=1 Tax=Pontibacillus litoralis JSM 072002 TaxID=1385512 RepID=A0A0A5G5B7_9BACI|nr:ATP-grasp fold amidoligase family protein [Pontibacillus litoralis]KGX87249.1 hypothetical protein N784_16330 [Pontibacillus litoralis JSM 072002]
MNKCDGESINVNNKERNHHQPDLLAQLIDTEAKIKELEQQQKQYEKQIKHMYKSNTWQKTGWLRKAYALVTGKAGRKQAAYIHYLETQLEATLEQLYATKELLSEQMVHNPGLSQYQIIDVIKEKKREGLLMDYLDKLIVHKQVLENNYNKALTYAARTFMKEQPAFRNHVYEQVLQGLKIEDIPEFMIRAGLDEESIPLVSTASYRASLNMRMRQYQWMGSLPEWSLDDKQEAYAFMDQLDIRRPWTSEHSFPLSDMPQHTQVAIKPVDGAGSRGVYLVRANDDIIDLKRANSIKSWNDLKTAMQEDLDSGWVEKDEWFMEELIFENKLEKQAASDVKFYCFYGKVGVILEIKRYPELAYCWWTADGQRIHTGKYEDELFKGQGVSKQELQLAANLSLEIPAPFIRIDFLRSEDGLVFGEFTPKPGNYDGFDQQTDQWLGDLFLEAEGRLSQDLLNGKSFEAFRRKMETTQQ